MEAAKPPIPGSPSDAAKTARSHAQDIITQIPTLNQKPVTPPDGGGIGDGSDTDSNEGTGEDTDAGTDSESGGTDVPHFSDVPADTWYQPAVAYVVQNGLMERTGEAHFAPEANLSRAMIVQVLYNLETRLNTPPETVPLDRTNGAPRPLKWCMVTATMVH